MKCIYCDFYSVVDRDNQIPIFVRQLIEEFRKYPPPRDQYAGVETIYLGGGTPSMLSGEQVRRLLKAVGQHLPVADNAEITLEANPGEVDCTRLQAYRDVGVNRMSFGLQSFHDTHLELLGRYHHSGQNRQSVRMAREAGFSNLNVDLIFRLPDETPGQLESDLDHMLALEAEHLSIYSLTVEPRTPLHRYVEEGSIRIPSDEMDAEMYRLIRRRVTDAGFQHYEISNFARPGFRSRHNSNYWNGTHYYGYGPSAHSYNGEERWWNVRDLGRYFQRMDSGESPVEQRELLDDFMRRREYLLTRLRTDQGLDRYEWKKNFSAALPEKLERYFRQLNEEHPGWVRETDRGWRLTGEGWLFADTVIEQSIDRVEKLFELR